MIFTSGFVWIDPSPKQDGARLLFFLKYIYIYTYTLVVLCLHTTVFDLGSLLLLQYNLSPFDLTCPN